MISPDTLLQNRYLVQRQIGKGGMGVVYLATDQRFGSTVALKETLVDKVHLRKAFEREARLLNHLKHSALPRVSDHFTEGEGQFLVMEFIPGADLSDLLKERGVPFSRVKVLEWADQLLDALDYLHTHEPPVVHRDIKPQNLKLTARDHIMLLDFGLAKGTLQASQMTATGSLFGYSFNYAPLEQMQGTGTDPRSDLYSLGATIYHLMTNVTPPDAITRATAVLNGEPDPLRPPHELQSQVTEPVARVIMRAMAQNAAQRPQTAAAMREALRVASHESLAVAGQTVAGAQAFAAEAQRQDEVGGASASVTPAARAATNDRQPNSSTGSRYDDLTVIEAASPKPARPPFPSRKRDEVSVVTEVRRYQPAAPKSWLPNPAFSIVMGVVLVTIIAAVVYTFTRQSATQTPTLQSTPASDPATTTTTSSSTEAQNTVPSSESYTAPAPQGGNPAGNSPQSQPAAVSATPPPAATDNNPTTAQPTSQSTSIGPTTSSSPTLSPEEERARKADEIRRIRREKEEEDMRKRREAMEEEQRKEQERKEQERINMEAERARQRREQPMPPPGGFPPPPPPRRGGPPPY